MDLPIKTSKIRGFRLTLKTKVFRSFCCFPENSSLVPDLKKQLGFGRQKIKPNRTLRKTEAKTSPEKQNQGVVFCVLWAHPKVSAPLRKPPSDGAKHLAKSRKKF